LKVGRRGEKKRQGVTKRRGGKEVCYSSNLTGGGIHYLKRLHSIYKKKNKREIYFRILCAQKGNREE